MGIASYPTRSKASFDLVKDAVESARQKKEKKVEWYVQVESEMRIERDQAV